MGFERAATWPDLKRAWTAGGQLPLRIRLKRVAISERLVVDVRRTSSM